MERRLVLNSLANTRRTISRLARDYYNGDFQNNLDAAGYRLVLEMLKQVVACHKEEANLKLAEEVGEIKKILKAKGLIS